MTVSERFKVQTDHILGEGSFGKVFKGYDLKTRQSVAIKHITLTDKMHWVEVREEIEIMKVLT